MQSVLDKLYDKTRDDAISEILSLYDQGEAVVVNFLYFAVIASQNLFEDGEKTEKEKEYKKILLKSDFLLPDGIALQLFYAFARLCGKVKSPHPYWLKNLNGTDFVPYFLSDLKKKYWSQKICLLLYWTRPEYLQKAEDTLKFQWYNVIYSQDGYSDFDWEKADAALEEYQDTINVLLVARSTPKIPLQELWTSRNYQKIQQRKLLVFNTWGLLDFIAKVQSRAPKFWRTLKLERLYRLITDPKRNLKKVANSFLLFPYLFKYCLFWAAKKSS